MLDSAKGDARMQKEQGCVLQKPVLYRSKGIKVVIEILFWMQDDVSLEGGESH